MWPILPRPSWAGFACTGVFFHDGVTGCAAVSLPLFGLDLEPWVSLFTPSFNCLCFVVWLGFTTSCRRTFERDLRSLARCTSLHVRFTRFHQDLGWLSCLRSPTFRHAVDHFVIRVSPDISASLLLTLDTCVIGAFYPTIECALLSQVSRTQ